MIGAFVEHASDVGGQRHIARQLLGENALPVVDFSIDKPLADRG